MKRDFTLKKYQEVCKVIKNTNYRTLTLSEYLSDVDGFQNTKFIIIRHDIDNKVDLPIAFKMAEYENKLGIRASYYFRTIEDTFDKDLIKQIYGLNHEVGYHFEVLNEAKGDLNKAIDLFSMHLTEFRKIVPVLTICQHGGSLGENTASSIKGILQTSWEVIIGKMKLKSYRSNDIWKVESMTNYDLLGEAYLSLDFNKILYLSDTGLRWDGHKNRVLDVVDSVYFDDKNIIARTTDDVKHLICSEKYDKINLLVHPANWIDPILQWTIWQGLQILRNVGKRIVFKK